MREKVRHLGSDNLLGVTGSESGLNHRGRVDIDLDHRLPSGKDVLFEFRRDIDDKGVFPLVHQGYDVLFHDLLRQLEVRRQECVGDAA
jgi:hypothetical protein